MQKDKKSNSRIIIFTLVVLMFLFSGKSNTDLRAIYDFNLYSGVAISCINAAISNNTISKDNHNNNNSTVVAINENRNNVINEDYYSCIENDLTANNNNPTRYNLNIFYNNYRILHPPLSKLKVLRI